MTKFERYLRPRPKVHPLVWLVPVVLLISVVALGSHAFKESSRLTALQERIQDLHAAQAVKPAPRGRKADFELQKRWTELGLERDFPWQRVFAAVERADRDTVELLEFKPEKRTQRIFLRGEARDVDALTGYLEGLADDESLSNVHLVQRQIIVRGAQTTVGFEIKARVAVSIR